MLVARIERPPLQEGAVCASRRLGEPPAAAAKPLPPGEVPQCARWGGEGRKAGKSSSAQNPKQKRHSKPARTLARQSPGSFRRPPLRQKKPAPFLFRRDGESSISAASFLPSEPEPFHWVPVWVRHGPVCASRRLGENPRRSRGKAAAPYPTVILCSSSATLAASGSSVYTARIPPPSSTAFASAASPAS